jgi:5-methylcytosine-specific restriction endonuclease McrA
MNSSEKSKPTQRQRAAQATFMRRSYSIYKHMSTRIKGPPFNHEVPFALDDFRAKITATLNLSCPYCGGQLTVKNFSADHMMPLNRVDEIVGIAWLSRLDNVTICCIPCQRMKGAMDGNEYRRLITLTAEFDPLAQRDLRRRLKAGGAVIRCGIATF